MYRIISRSFLFVLFLLLAACGGSGGGDGANSPEPVESDSLDSLKGSESDGSGNDEEPAPPPHSGVITDSPIANIRYRTSSEYENSTDETGRFLYSDDDSIVFVIGSLEFPRVKAKSVVTPFDLFDVRDTNDQQLVNFLRLVQSLDDDGDISRSIKLSEKVHDVVSNAGLQFSDFNLSLSEFESSETVRSLLSELNLSALVSEVEAVAHFEATLRNSEIIDLDGDGQYNSNDSDDDGDGIVDEMDTMPYDQAVSGDVDGDGQDNIIDSDDDGDGVADSEDEFPFDGEEWLDTDGDSIGDNRDDDDDGDGVLDELDAFPLDSSESSDTDGDSVGDNADTDDDNDGIPDERDQYPFDAAESRDFDLDGIPDNTDKDDDNDSVADLEDRLNLVGFKPIYMQEEVIKLTAEAFDPNMKIGKRADGWNIQFYTYNIEDPSRRLTEYDSWNAQFDTVSKTWSMEYWAPRKPGEYKTVVSFYCARRSQLCDGHYGSASYRQEFLFTSTCEVKPCTYELDEPQGNYVTNSYDYSGSPAFVQRESGDLVGVLEEGSSSHFVQSTDGGKTWSKTELAFKHHGDFALRETSEGVLQFLAGCSFSGVCIYESQSGTDWTRLSLSEETDFSRCNTQECFLNNVSGDSIIQGLDGNYVVTYSMSVDENLDVFVTSSPDLRSWSEPVRVSTGEDWDFDSTIVQAQDGTYYLAHIAYNPDRIALMSSVDLVDWEEVDSLSRATHLHMRPELLVLGGRPIVFFKNYGSYYYSYLNSSGQQFTYPQRILEDMSFGPDVHLLQNGNLGLMYSMDLNNQRDVFYEEVDAPPIAD